MALGGRAAEEVALGSITTGAENDLQAVTGIARQMVTRWGMSARVGLVSFAQESSQFLGSEAAESGPRVYSEETAQIIDEEVRTLVLEAYEHVKALLKECRSTLDRIAQELRRHESLDQQQLLALLKETGCDVQALPQLVSLMGSF